MTTMSSNEKNMYCTKILQINLGRARAAHDVAHATAKREKVDIILASEPNKKIIKRCGLTDEREDAAVILVNKNIRAKGIYRGGGYVRLELENADLYSCYISPNIKIEEFKKTVDDIMNEVRNRKKEAIVAGDFNAKSQLWSSPKQDKRGEYIEEWAATLNLTILNEGDSPTFVRGSSGTYIDITLSTKKIARAVKNWKVTEEESMSLHNHIMYEIENVVEDGKRDPFREKIIDWRKVERILKNNLTNVNPTIKKITAVIKDAQISSTQRKEEKEDKPYWWNDVIEGKRKNCIRLRRNILRMKKKGKYDEITQEELKKSRKELKKEINSEKKKHWDRLCDELDNDVWGEGYKIVTKLMKGHQISLKLSKECILKIAKELFPRGEIQEETRTIDRTHYSIAKFTHEELENAVCRAKNGKAPGIDGIRNESIKLAHQIAPTKLLEGFNRLLEKVEFPEEWKRAKLALIPKPGKKNIMEASSHRPICLTDTLSKVYESMLKERIEKEIETRSPLSERQYGFRRGKSTVHAIKYVLGEIRGVQKGWCLMATIDIKNAFNTASWGIIKRKIRERVGNGYLAEICDKYLREREVEIMGEKIHLKMGVPQGSVLGPLMWNIMYDDVLRLRYPSGCQAIAYADDLALLVIDKRKDEMVRKANEAIGLVQRWMEENELKLATEKTEVLVIPRGHRNKENTEIEVGGKIIKDQKCIKYLGVWIDSGITFGHHVEKTIEKVNGQCSGMTRLLPNVRGPGSEKRRVMLGVITSTLLYAVPAWGHTLKRKKYKQKIISSQRKGNLRIATAYRTVSADALCVIAGQIPITLLAEERMELFEKKCTTEKEKKEIRLEIIKKWQEEWDRSEKGRWTYRLIKDVARWYNCSFRKTNYFFTQFLSGHGCFKKYLFRFKRSNTEACPYCQEEDTPEHVIFSCDRWAEDRRKINLELGEELTMDTLGEKIVKNESDFGKIYDYITTVIKGKEREEKEVSETAVQ